MKIMIQDSNLLNQFDNINEITIKNKKFNKTITNSNNSDLFYFSDAAYVGVKNSSGQLVEYIVIDLFITIKNKFVSMFGSFIDGMIKDEEVKELVDLSYDKKRLKLLKKKSYFSLSVNEYKEFANLEIIEKINKLSKTYKVNERNINE